MSEETTAMLTAALVVFVGAFIAEPLLLALFRLLGLFAVVRDRKPFVPRLGPAAA
jgi:hypothetical protein